MVDEKFSCLKRKRKLKFIKEDMRDVSLNGKMDDKFKYFLWLLRKIRDFKGI